MSDAHQYSKLGGATIAYHQSSQNPIQLSVTSPHACPKHVVVSETIAGCQAAGCQMSHTQHFCKVCGDTNANHRSSQCPTNVGVASQNAGCRGGRSYPEKKDTEQYVHKSSATRQQIQYTRGSQDEVYARLPNFDYRWSSVVASLKKLQLTAMRGLYNVKEIFSDIFLSFRQNDCDALIRTIDELDLSELQNLLLKVLPFMAELAIEVGSFFPNVDALPLLMQKTRSFCDLTQQQCCCLLSLAFFDAFPEPASQELHKTFSLRFLLATQMEKLKCVLCYFCTMQKRKEVDPMWGMKKIRFVRKTATVTKDVLLNSPHKLILPDISTQGCIESCDGHLQADFANEAIGGGVLGTGLVQEEIRFSVCPECLVSILLCDRMEETDAIVIIGADRFCNYSGYASTFKFTGAYEDCGKHEVDVNGLINIQLVAFDALPVSHNPKVQYQEDCILRDIVKLHAALCYDNNHDFEGQNSLKPFATGNWGCGAFGGDVQLKFLLQWIMSSFHGRKLRYFPFGDRGLLK